MDVMYVEIMYTFEPSKFNTFVFTVPFKPFGVKLNKN